MPNYQYRVGMKVRLVETAPRFDSEDMRVAMNIHGAQEGGVYEVVRVSENKLRIKLGTVPWWLDKHRFKPAKPTNKERVRLRMEKLNEQTTT